jgi:hypothetical protein
MFITQLIRDKAPKYVQLNRVSSLDILLCMYGEQLALLAGSQWAMLRHYACEANCRPNWRFRNYSPFKLAPTLTWLASFQNKKEAPLRATYFNHIRYEQAARRFVLFWSSHVHRVTVLSDGSDFVPSMAFIYAFLTEVTLTGRLRGDPVHTDTAEGRCGHFTYNHQLYSFLYMRLPEFYGTAFMLLTVGIKCYSCSGKTVVFVHHFLINMDSNLIIY